MKNIIQSILFLLCILLTNKSYTQDFVNINFQGDQSAQITPKNIITSGDYRFLLYDKVNTVDPSNPYIGVVKINNSTNQVEFDVTFNLSNNTSYPYGHAISAVDIEIDKEISGGALYILASLGSRDILLLTLEQSTGAIRQKKLIYSYQTSFIPTDLTFGESNDINDPYIGIVGYSNVGNGLILLLYKKLSESNFASVIVDQPGLGSYKYDNCHISNLGGTTSTATDVEITYVSKPSYSTTQNASINGLSINLINNTISKYWEFEIEHNYGGPLIPIRNFKHTLWDDADAYYGQFTNDDNTLNGDFFIIWLTGGAQPLIYTYNNPNFKLVNCDAHPNFLIFNGGASVGSVGPKQKQAFVGLYYDPSDITHPRYAAGSLDIGNVPYSLYPLCNAYTLRNNSVGNNNISDFFGASTFLGDEMTSFLYRKPLTTADASNAYYSKQVSANSSCASPITFTPTYDKNAYYFVSGVNYLNSYLHVARFDLPNISDLDVANYDNATGQLTAVCEERLTNSLFDPPGGDGIWDPICGCYALPGGNQLRKNSTANPTPEERSGADFSIFPNPILNDNTITCQSTTIIRNIVIQDASGKTIAAKSNILAKQTKIILPVISAGTYFVQMTTIDGQRRTGKVIKL